MVTLSFRCSNGRGYSSRSDLAENVLSSRLRGYIINSAYSSGLESSLTVTHAGGLPPGAENKQPYRFWPLAPCSNRGSESALAGEADIDDPSPIDLDQ
jgi:hypothetical protein